MAAPRGCARIRHARRQTNSRKTTSNLCTQCRAVLIRRKARWRRRWRTVELDHHKRVLQYKILKILRVTILLPSVCGSGVLRAVIGRLELRRRELRPVWQGKTAHSPTSTCTFELASTALLAAMIPAASSPSFAISLSLAVSLCPCLSASLTLSPRLCLCVCVSRFLSIYLSTRSRARALGPSLAPSGPLSPGSFAST